MTPLELIWNGWRIRYIEGAPPAPHEGSVFTQILASGLPDEETNIVHRGTHTFAILNAFPYTTGHLMVLPYREIDGTGGAGRATRPPSCGRWSPTPSPR